MPRARYPEALRVCAYCGEHWTQRDGQAPRSYCTTTCRYAAEGRPWSCPAAPPAEPVLPSRVRRVQARLVTLTCAWCHARAEVAHFPGPLPRYCSDDCRADAQRCRAAERMRQLRQRRLLASLTVAASPARP